MSMSATNTVTCPQCQHEQDFTVWQSMNVTLDPELKEQLLSGELNAFICQKCAEKTSVAYDTLYHDMRLGLWLYLSHGDEKPGEDFSRVQSMMAKTARVPYRYRLVRNRNELVEKILIFDAGLDDRMVEIFKLMLGQHISEQGRNVDELLFQRIGEKEGDGEGQIGFVIISGEEQDSISVPLPTYENVAATHAHLLPDAATETGTLLRVDSAYAVGLDWDGAAGKD